MKKSEILYKAVTEHLRMTEKDTLSYKEQYYLCLAVREVSENTWIRDTIAEDVIRNKNHAIFLNSAGRRDQMQIAMYGLFLSEWFKDTEC